MSCIEITVTNDTGLHTRPGNELVKLVKSFEGTTIELEKGDKKVTGNSLLKIMSLAVKKGDVIKIHISGGEEAKIEEQLVEFFANLKD